jgi:hypothetical protein
MLGKDAGPLVCIWRRRRRRRRRRRGGGIGPWQDL